MTANTALIIIATLMVLSFSIGSTNSRAATRDEVMSAINAGESETALEGY